MSLGRIAFVAALAGAVALTFSHSQDFETQERVRIQAHFDSVLGELRARDLSDLTVAQRSHRAHLIHVLASYRDAGKFPHNYDRPGLVPTFIDPITGVRCAVGYLITSTGAGKVVERIAREDNHVLVAALATDTAVTSWLDTNGFTLAEAARIQMPYTIAPQAEESRPRAYVGDAPAVALSAGAVGLTAWNLLRNRHGERHAIAAAGVATGALGVIGGNLLLSSGQASPDKARAAIWTGLASAVSGAVSMLPVFGNNADHVTVTPTVRRTQESKTQLGLSGQIRF